MATPFIGQIFQFAFTFAPQDYGFCSGAVMPINQNQALFALLGTTFGGNGRTDFNLPDLRGRVAVHPGVLPNHPAVNRGTIGGFETITLNSTNIPPHRHKMQATTTQGSQSFLGNNILAEASASAAVPYGYSPSAQITISSGTCAAVGSGQSHNNIQPVNVINFCIALDGAFPPRS